MNENKSDDDTSELEDLFTVISIFFSFRSYELVFSSFQSHELFFFFRSHELFISSRSYEFRSFWILDHDVSVHICNSTMKHRFIIEKDEFDQRIIADSQKLIVAAYKHIRIKHENERKSRDMILTNVFYISEFMTNIVSRFVFQQKELNFNTKNYRLHQDNVTYEYAKSKFNHYIMKNNIKSFIESQHIAFFDFSFSFFVTAYIKKTSVNDWHQMLAHSEREIIQNLENFVNEVKITFDEQISNKCETCALFKAHKLVFCFIEKSEFFNKSFHRIIYDLMQLIDVINKNKWIFHLICFEYNFNLIFIHSHKFDAIKIIKKRLKIIQIKFNAKIVFFRTNDEKSLKKKFDDMISELEIIYESSASYIFEQNKHFERKNDFIAMKTRTFRIYVNLFFYLWFWIVRVVEFLMNRISMKNHEWKISFEIIIDIKSNFFHFYKFNCKIYSFNNIIFKKKSLKKERMLIIS